MAMGTWLHNFTGSGRLVLNAIQPVRLLLDILSHFELIPDAALTLTLTRKRYK